MKKNLIIIGVVCTLNLYGQIPVDFNLPDIMIESSSAPNSQYLNLGENSVYINPINPNYLFNSNNASYEVPGQPDITGQAMFFSNDGGQTWMSAINSGYVFPTQGADPSVVVDRNNRKYLNYLTSDINILYSDNNFSSYAGPNVLSATYSDKNFLELDDRPISDNVKLFCGWIDNTLHNIYIRRGEVFNQNVIWNNATDDLTDPLVYIIPVIPGVVFKYPQGVNIAVAPDGDAYATWGLYYGNGAANTFERSIGFATWSHTLQTWTSSYIPDLEIKGIRNNVSIATAIAMSCASWMTMAVNQQNGDLYIAWPNVGNPCTPGISNCNLCTTPGYCISDIYIIKSSDKGLTWSIPKQISISNNPHWDSWLAIDPYTGYLGVIYYGVDNSGNTQTYLSLSVDQGNNWTEQQISDYSFTSSTFNRVPRTDYINLKMNNGLVVPVWTGIDQNNGRQTAFCQPFNMDVPTDLSLCNPVTQYYEISKAQQHISVSDFGCGYQVASGSYLNMYANDYIKLSPGFQAETGSKFRAHIEQNVDPFNANERTGFTNQIVKKSSNSDFFVSAFPNPFKEYVNISITTQSSSSVTMDLFDNMGRLIKRLLQNEFVTKGTTNYHLNCNDVKLNPGIYNCVISYDKGKKAVKLICIN